MLFAGRVLFINGFKDLATIFSCCLVFLLFISSSPQAQDGAIPVDPNLYLPIINKDYTPPVSIFGVEIGGAITDSYGLSQAISAKASWVRFDAFDWDRIEPQLTTPATYHWKQVDEGSLANAAQSGLKVIAVVKYTPEWAQKYPGSACGPIHSNAFSKWADFLFALVSRYKNPPFNVKHWELGNEPDAPLWYARSVFGCWGEVNDEYFGGEQYAQMLKAAYPAIKAADPQAKVLIGGLLLDSPDEQQKTATRFLEGILKGGGGPYFDLVSFHGYAYFTGTIGQMYNPHWTGATTTVREKAEFIRGVLNRYGQGNKGLLNTEAALYCFSETPGCLETQAVFVPRAFAEAMTANLEGLVYYALKGDFRSLGLLRNDGSPRPSYNAYKTAASFLTKARLLGPAVDYPAGTTGYSFVQESGKRLDLVWSSDGMEMVIKVNPGSMIFDRYGNPIAVTGDTVPVDYGPMYIQKP